MAKEVNSSIKINAKKNQVWKTLTDFKSYPEWNPFILKAEGNLAKGEKLNIEVDGMKFTPTVTELVPEQKLTWLGNFILPYLFDGRHSFEVKTLEDGSTEFIHSETFSGILPVFLSKKFFNSIESSFQKMNIALKQHCED